ncbi:unnamed protein product [Rotaria sp. Silwood2]|nr:unnamed protein product [Rotaria sp. Silwood2]
MMASTSKYDLDMSETFTNVSTDTDSISDFNIWSSSEQEEGQDSESDSEKEEEEEVQDTKEYFKERTWRTDRFKPKRSIFDSSKSGISFHLSKIDENSSLDYFRLIFDNTLMEKIIEETNRYILFLMQQKSLSEGRIKAIDTIVSEMFTFFALYMLMSHRKKSRMKDYWSTDSLISTPTFGSIMSRDRFLLLLRFLHFNDNEYQPTNDKLYKIKPIINYLRERFGQLLVPYQNVCIDESLILWKDRLSFKQYIPSKRSRFGIKLYVLCDVNTEIILDFIVYTGATTDMERFSDKGHNLFVDNLFTSVSLFEKLFERSTGACGTVRKDRLGLPEFQAKIGKGPQVYKNTDNMLALKWHDKNDVIILSTIHEPQMKNTERNSTTIQKSVSVIDYNFNIHMIDKADTQISLVECLRKTVKWYRKLFFHMLDLSVFNSYVHNKVNTVKKRKCVDYRLQLIHEVLQTYTVAKPTIGRPTLTDLSTRLTDRQFPSLVPETTNRQTRQRKCVVCAHTSRIPRKRTDSRYMCKDCDVALCVVGCFQKFHNLLHF